MDRDSIVLTVVSLLIGGVIGALTSYFISWWYYRKASEDMRRELGALRQETTELRSISSDIQRYLLSLIDHLDNAGVVEVARNPQTGEPLAVRLRRTTHPTATAKGVASHDWKVIPRKDIPAGDYSAAEDILRDLRAEEQDDR
jgi:hypothetical protein